MRQRKDILEKEKRIIEEYSNGKSMKYLSREYNCSPNTIKRILKNNNINIRLKHIFTKEEIKIKGEKISKSKIGHVVTEKTRQKLKVANLGKKNPQQSETMKKLFAEGKIKLWNTGLTKETDERLNNASLKQSESRLRGVKEGKIKVWNAGLTKEDPRIMNITKILEEKVYSKIRNKTYEEIYGEEKAKEITDKMGKIQSIIKKGEGNPMFGKLGILNPNFGRKCSLETIEKLRFNNLGKKIHSEKWKLEQKEKMTGEKNPMKNSENKKKLSIAIQEVSPEDWKGFISFEPYTLEFNKEFKNLVRLRDNFCCLNCGVSEQKHIIITGSKLSIHHINYIKKDTCLQNCVSLCYKCNALANKNRNEWKEYYQDKLSKLYNYQYSETEEIMLNKFQNKIINNIQINKQI